jgi:hypothetical protein
MVAIERDAVRAVFGCELVVVVLVARPLGMSRTRGLEVHGGDRCGTTEHAP